MKKLFVMVTALAFTIGMTAVPARKNTWKTLRLSNGTEVKAMLTGDEFGHYWRAADGKAYIQAADADYYVPAQADHLMQQAQERRLEANHKRMQRLPRQASPKAAQGYFGKKKGLIILVNFTDMAFMEGHDNAMYQRIANEEGYAEGDFKGSMVDYFKHQSLGQFELDFDIMGPVTVSKEMAYYGGNDKQGNDKHPADMVIEAVNLVKDEVADWQQYDWNNDGEVDQIYVVYAGRSEADGGDANTIWPHAYDLYDANYYGDGSGPVTVAAGLKVNNYACGSELGYTGKIDGIGTMCHEFSHCLGYPDFYDTDYSGGQGMDCWDLMDQGCYNGNGYRPAGYTSYERWVAGWIEPTTLEDKDTVITSMQSLQDSGECYIIYNKGNRNEYFLLENRQRTAWDTSLPAGGLLILHVDYDQSVWLNNQPNDDPKHQRMTWIPADDKYQSSYYQGRKYYTTEGMKTDPYPYKTNNAFNKYTRPAAELYNKNSDYTHYLNSSVEQITQNADGTISFSFVANKTVNPTPEEELFYESFNQCDGLAGWSGAVANGTFLPDNEGWEAPNAKGGNQCARFGTTSNVGTATTPPIALNGTATMTFLAGAWNGNKDGTTLSLTATGGSIEPATVTLTKGEWEKYEVTITGNGSVNITFAQASGRFFLDEVVITKPSSDAIHSLNAAKPATTRIYTLDGRYVGTNPSLLPHGLYMVGGKKIVR